MGAFSAKFSTPPSGKTMDWTPKSMCLKWWHGPPLSPCKIWWKSRDGRRSERMKCDVFHFFDNNASRPSTALVRLELLPKDIVSAFLGRFRWHLQLFSEEKPFPGYSTVFKIFARGRYDWCPNSPKKFENLRKWVQSLCAPLRPFRSEMKENFYHSPILHVL